MSKSKASEDLQRHPRAMVVAWVKLGRVEDDCGLLAEEEAAEAEGRAPRAQPTRKGAEIVQLPLWPEATRGTPNSFLRGSLFAAIQGKERQALKREVLACQKGAVIRFTGWQLDQSDLDVWEQAAELARSHPLGNVCHFHINGFLRALGRNKGKSDHEWLKDSFARLAGCCVEISDGRYTYGGSMLEFRRDEITNVYILRLNPTILDLYKAGWTAVDWDARHKLRRKPLALWLHGWLSSNAQNFPISVEKLHQLSGSRAKAIYHFKEKLKAALADLEIATGGRMAGTINGDLVEWTRQLPATQARHLAKKARHPRKPRQS